MATETTATITEQEAEAVVLALGPQLEWSGANDSLWAYDDDGAYNVYATAYPDKWGATYGMYGTHSLFKQPFFFSSQDLAKAYCEKLLARRQRN